MCDRTICCLFQPELPRLPVPDLEQTMHKYVATLQPLLTNNQLEYTKSLVQTFLAPNGRGPKVQAQLLQRQRKLDNWVCTPTYSTLVTVV